MESGNLVQPDNDRLVFLDIPQIGFDINGSKRIDKAVTILISSIELCCTYVCSSFQSECSLCSPYPKRD
jgi:hypothetical protein